MNTTYDFYEDVFGGSVVPEKKWDNLSLRMEQKLRYFTHDRMPDKWSGESWENLAKTAVCEMVDYAFKVDKRDGISSENTDGYSVSYDTSKNSTDTKLYEIAKVYLLNTGLLYLGVD